MAQSLPGALLAMVLGIGVALLNYALTRSVLRKKPDRVAAFFSVRQIINVAYLAGVYFLSALLPWNRTVVLLGAALGLTVPSMLLATRLSRTPTAGQDGNETDKKGEE